jgi:hypothetical protein
MWRVVPEAEKLTYKQLAAQMQTEFKMRHPNYSYKKAAKSEVQNHTSPATDETLLPPAFRLDQMLNHH